jgi:hemerythrin-like domain-containing protein
MLTKLYRDEHIEIVELTRTFESMLDPVRLQTRAAHARRALSILSGKLRHHWANEESLLYPEFAVHHNETIRQLAMRYQLEMRPLAQAFQAYSNKWLAPSNIAAEAPQFIEESKQVLRALKEHISKEDAEFYTTLDRGG